jgi:hypothetical protein
MRIDEKLEKAYRRHSVNQTVRDGKERKFYFEIENIESDYEKVRELMRKHEPLCFDFVASCLRNCAPNIRFFSKNFTGRFSVDKKISLDELKQKLIDDGYTFISKGKKSGPLCLNADYSEPLSVKIFRMFLPVLEIKLWFYRKFILKLLHP